MRMMMLLFWSVLANAALPVGSELLSVADSHYHVRRLATNDAAATTPAIVLLSGPSGRWHSDSAWFALLQPLLAQHYRTYAIDRAGHGFGDAATQSYQSFGAALPAILTRLNEPSVVIVAFASANLALAHYLNSADAARVKGVLLIDPDALAPETVAFYANQAQDFQKPALADYVRAGKYDQRAANARQSERDEVAKLIPAALQSVMDWVFYDAVTAARTERERIVQRFAEIGRYDHDVRSAAARPWPAPITTVVWDTDFEADDIANNPGNAELVAWREHSTRWFAQQFGPCHIARPSRHHLAMFAEADALLAQVRALAEGRACR
jgi:pimeloyl-ACP methyl ester carboxylesterase